MASSWLTMAWLSAALVGCGALGPVRQEPIPPQIAVSYEGQLALDGNMIPVRTLLIRGADRVQRGYYAFWDQGRWLFGLLLECAEVGPHQVRCRWEDPYGVGRMQMTFAENWSAFDGFWVNGLDDGGDQHPWNGRVVGSQPDRIAARD